MGGLVLIQPSLILVLLIKALKLFSCRLDDETLMRLYTKLTSCRLIQYEVESKHAFVFFKRFVHIDLIYNHYLFKDHLISNHFSFLGGRTLLVQIQHSRLQCDQQ